MKQNLLSFLFAACALTASAQQWTGTTIPPVERSRYQELFVTHPGQQPYRIPAIAQAKNGNLIAVSDHRPCGSDIGYGEVDIKVRISKDNGKTWGEERFIANGTGVKGAPDCGFGDAAIVADRQSNEVLILCVHGETPYWNGNYPEGNPNPVGVLRSMDGGETWEPYEGISEQIYSPFRQSKHGMIKSLFFGSGRLCQSSRIKVGSHYRIYGAVAARDGGNRVFYSDDFGRTWQVLGGVDALPCPEGDEPKIEELPNGNVLLSSRVFPQKWHRLYNIYAYDNVKTASGAWAKAAHTGALPSGVLAERNNTDGEILIVPALRKADRKRVHLALQSVPFGPGRANVGIYFKALTPADYTSPEHFGSHWEGRHQVSTLPSAYSTMIVQADRRIAFYYEEQTHGKGADYTEVYVPLTLEDITGGRYAIDPKYKPLGRQKLEK